MSAPIIVSTPVDTYPRLCALRIAFWVSLFNERRAASLRWRARNAAQAALCQCGAEGTVRVADGGNVVGSTRPYWWRCEEHVGVSLSAPVVWTPATGVRWAINEPRETCSWAQTTMKGRLIGECGCGTHVGEQPADWRTLS